MHAVQQPTNQQTDNRQQQTATADCAELLSEVLCLCSERGEWRDGARDGHLATPSSYLRPATTDYDYLTKDLLLSFGCAVPVPYIPLFIPSRLPAPG